MSSTSNSVIKKEFTVSRSVVVPVYPNLASAPEPVAGSIAYNAATQGLILSDGNSWASPSASVATTTTRGILYGYTPDSPNTTVCLGNGNGTAPAGNVFVGFRAGYNSNGAQTGLTLVGYISGLSVQAVSNKTMIGDSSGGNANSQQNSTGIGSFVFSLSTAGSNNCAAGQDSQSRNTGSGNCSIGSTALGITGTSAFDNCVGIGLDVLSSGTSSGIINIGTSPGFTYWNPGTSTDVVFLGNSTSLSSNITNVVALGFGNFSGVVANNTLVVADNITQWRSSGLSVSASANVLQFDPATGLITQAASSQRFKQNIQTPPADASSDILNMKIRTYEIDGQTDHGAISEDIPEKYVTVDIEGRRNGVKMLRIIMSLLSEIQVLNEQLSFIEARA